MSKTKRILMVAAENDALPGAKVGGVGDVLRDLPNALIKEGAAVDTVIPSYGFLSRLDGLEPLGGVTVNFADQRFYVEVLKLPGETNHYIIDHPLFYQKSETVYFNDKDNRPFATDASKFAFYGACAAQALKDNIIPTPDVIHYHDWHSAFLLILLKFDLQFISLRDIKSIFTIHNLAMQGIRPFQGDESSFENWYPNLRFSIDKIADPRYQDCINPMRAGILLADKVHTVSPSYANEILNESHHELGIYGGDGLENDLRARTDAGEVSGILNGCEYDNYTPDKALTKTKLVKLMRQSVETWATQTKVLSSPHWIAEKRIAQWAAKKSAEFIVTSVGRLTEQKVRVLHTPMPSGETALEGLLNALGSQGILIMLGSGNEELEQFVAETSVVHSNLIFLNGYSNELSNALYHTGDLFLMPSSFEPCGISQMLSMRAGQPCLVNAVGGLKDTISDMENGFVYQAESIEQQAVALVKRFKEVMALYKNDHESWKLIKSNASEMRFTWHDTAMHFLHELY